MTIDKTNIQQPVMYWMSLEGYLNVADIYGCMCNTVLNASFSKGTSLTVDKMNIYWSDAENDQIYFSRKGYSLSPGHDNASEPEIKSFYLSSIRSIKAFGKSLQPYPPAKCLIPSRMNYTVQNLTVTANSIIVNLSEPVPDYGCERYNLPTTLYTISVSQCLGDDSDKCRNHGRTNKVQTYEGQNITDPYRYEIQDLKPFTEYRLKLALSNYYSGLTSMSLEFDSGVILRTGPGKPSIPENVTVEVLTPNLVAVYWMPPKILNSEAVNYEVHWRSSDMENGMRQKGEQLYKESERTADGRFYMLLQSLQPGLEYAVYVRAYSIHSSEFFNQSVLRNVQMYPEPNNLTLSGASVNSLNLSWVPNVNLTTDYVLEYRDIATEDWQVANNSEMEKGIVTYHIEDLQPRTTYKFRLILKYSTYRKDFIWPTDGGFTFETVGECESRFFHRRIE